MKELTKKKNTCHNCSSTEHYANNCPKAKRKVYSIEKIPEDAFPTEDSESNSLSDSIREQSDDYQDPKEEFLVEYQGKIGHNEIVEITTPVLINWNDGKSRLGENFRALNNYTKADRNPIPKIPHALDKLAKARYITKMDFMKGFH
ncbi:hypothetical protein O181_024799 [Austropuccinia psidii MF-1]|uniref:CCHC-type domain-containing protein n=1 Tax=Austropuccinia psidii MF-1 TaxID=1389203 RepID=A0A9Q3CGV7_9BASI|nr:hypothetical protein [Austropuccinia psidii MF-1]